MARTAGGTVLSIDKARAEIAGLVDVWQGPDIPVKFARIAPDGKEHHIPVPGGGAHFVVPPKDLLHVEDYCRDTLGGGCAFKVSAWKPDATTGEVPNKPWIVFKTPVVPPKDGQTEAFLPDDPTQVMGAMGGPPPGPPPPPGMFGPPGATGPGGPAHGPANPGQTAYPGGPFQPPWGQQHYGGQHMGYTWGTPWQGGGYGGYGGGWAPPPQQPQVVMIPAPAPVAAPAVSAESEALRARLEQERESRHLQQIEALREDARRRDEEFKRMLDERDRRDREERDRRDRDEKERREREDRDRERGAQVKPTEWLIAAAPYLDRLLDKLKPPEQDPNMKELISAAVKNLIEPPSEPPMIVRMGQAMSEIIAGQVNTSASLLRAMATMQRQASAVGGGGSPVVQAVDKAIDKLMGLGMALVAGLREEANGMGDQGDQGDEGGGEQPQEQQQLPPAQQQAAPLPPAQQPAPVAPPNGASGPREIPVPPPTGPRIVKEAPKEEPLLRKVERQLRAALDEKSQMRIDHAAMSVVAYLQAAAVEGTPAQQSQAKAMAQQMGTGEFASVVAALAGGETARTKAIGAALESAAMKQREAQGAQGDEEEEEDAQPVPPGAA